MPSGTLLVVDDEKNIRRSVDLICSGEGYTVRTADCAEEAFRIIRSEPIDLVLLDLNLPDMDGLEMLKTWQSDYPDLISIVITGYATIENAIAATRYGAYDFIEKPIHKEKLLLAIKNALRHHRLQQENLQLRRTVSSRYEMIGKSPAIQSIREQIQKVAPTDGRVLILGESGTGKELIARAIHENSRRRDKPFVRVNCAAIPEELIESELFGSEKGAFTGAVETREGKFSQADGGTIFLDEVGDMSLKVQAKVLRVLQEGEFEKVGGRQIEKVDVRVIAATNKDLEDEVRQGRFREDLYFRLNVIPIVSPPLRERREDIPLLVEYFIRSYCHENGYRPIRLSPAAMTVLQRYDWPGNIRELKNIIERLIIMTGREEVDVTDLPLHLQLPEVRLDAHASAPMTLKAVKEKVERDYILAILRSQNWNISRAARILGIDRTNLHKKINYYRLSPESSGG